VERYGKNGGLGLIVYSTWRTAAKAEKALALYRKLKFVPAHAFVSEAEVDVDAFTKRKRP
jgi:hypothetical protein